MIPPKFQRGVSWISVLGGSDVLWQLKFEIDYGSAIQERKDRKIVNISKVWLHLIDLKRTKQTGRFEGSKWDLHTTSKAFPVIV